MNVNIILKGAKATLDERGGLDLSRCGFQSIETSTLGIRFCIQNHSIVVFPYEHQFSSVSMDLLHLELEMSLGNSEIIAGISAIDRRQWIMYILVWPSHLPFEFMGALM
jgi:hypothetical protein